MSKQYGFAGNSTTLRSGDKVFYLTDFKIRNLIAIEIRLTLSEKII